MTVDYVPRNASILIMSDDKTRPVHLADTLESSRLATFQVVVESDMGQAMHAITSLGADLVVVDSALQAPDPHVVVDEVREAAPHVPVAWLLDPEADEPIDPQLLVGLDDIVIWPDDGSIPADHALLHAVQRHRMLARLQERKLELRTLVHGITHDLRAPLISLEYLLDMARELVNPAAVDTQDVPELLDHLDHSRRTVDRLMSLVEEILRVAEVSGRRPKDQPLELHALATKVAEELSALAKRGKVSVHVDVDDHIVFGDRARFFHLMYNLLHNAIKHSPSGTSVHLTAKRLDPDDDQSPLRIQVRDSGAGISTEVPPDATVQQYLEIAPAQPGHGMGLQVAMLAASHHNAEVRVSNDPSGGVVFYMDLPAGRVIPAE